MKLISYLKLAYFIVIVLYFTNIAYSMGEIPTIDKGYNILKTEDVSYDTVKRYSLNISMTGEITPDNVKNICNSVITDQLQKGPISALMIFIYKPAAEGSGGYIKVGRAIWAPQGKWENADNVPLGKYTQHQLSLTLENIDKSNSEAKHSLPEATRKKIFINMVQLQDQGYSNEYVQNQIMKKYNVTLPVLFKIIGEGVENKWPMPFR